MYKMLIADDENGIRKGLTSLNWSASNIEVAADCDNGLMAYEFLKNNDDIDIVLTDICMPIMDGLELAAVIEKEFPHIITVVLSGYNDFNYAQKCMEYNVKYYLLKPIDADELNEVFKKINEELLKKDENKSHIEYLEQKARMAVRALRNDFFKTIISQKITADEFYEMSNCCELIMDSESFVVAVFKSVSGEPDNAPYETKSLINTGMERIMADNPDIKNAGYYYIEYAGCNVFLFINNSEIIENLIELKRICDGVLTRLERLSSITKTQFLCGVSEKCNSPENLFIAAQQATLCAAQSKSESGVVFYEKMTDEGGGNDFNFRTINDAVKYIKENFDKPLILAEVAAVVHLRPSYLSYLFKKTTGENFVDYVIGVKLEKAKQLLKDRKYKINEIGKFVGYQSPRYFTYVFKKYMGKSPYEYRKSLE